MKITGRPMHVEDANEECGRGCPAWEGPTMNYDPKAAAPQVGENEFPSIAHKAHSLVHGERAATYGHPRFDFEIIATVWTGLLKDLLKDGAKLDPYRVSILMSGLKLCRLVKSPQHHDSRVDTIGYMLTMERLDEPEETQEELRAKIVAEMSEKIFPPGAFSPKNTQCACIGRKGCYCNPEDPTPPTSPSDSVKLTGRFNPEDVMHMEGFGFSGETVTTKPAGSGGEGFIGWRTDAGGPDVDGPGGGGGSLNYRIVTRGGAGRNGDGTFTTDGKGCPQCGQIGNGGHGSGCSNTEKYDQDGNVIK